VRFGCYGGDRLKTVPMAVSLTAHRLLSTFQNSIDAYIAPSQFMKSKLIEGGFPEQHIHVIPNPGPSPSVSKTRSKEPLFAYAGRISSEKGILTLLAAFKDLKATVQIIGDGPGRETLKKRAAEAGRAQIQFLGLLPHAEVLDRLAQSWAAILPSQCYENLPFSALEAWACGTPLIATRLGGLKELLSLGGEPTLGFESGDIEGLKRCVQQVIDNPKLYTSPSRWRSLFDENFSEETVYPRLLSLYESILASSHRRRI